MAPQDLTDRLSAIETQWTALFQAHRDPGDATTAAQRQLLLRYYGAVYRYLLGILHDAVAAEDLTQEFAVRFLRGDFHRADPQRGRFRDFLKTALRHLAQDHWRKQEKAPAHLAHGSGQPSAAGSEENEEGDKAFLDKWREELLAHTWKSLAAFQESSGQLSYAVLRCKAEQPQLHSVDLAARLGAHRGKPLTANGVRQLLHRARRKFAELLVEEVARSLQTSDPATLGEELIALKLFSYCRAALKHIPG
ncbi:MAG TPA: sigma-70 family RNA polymerase sigma factor [Gemmataceae bacterium]|jgi:RNA polymerase sigma-70 factor (ECF subfamily)|nr:sigma-70 family RNA polymerase sigma factor [Gemmataceae bacterium]